MAFPTSIDTFTTKVDGDIHWAEHQNELQNAILAIETYIGSSTNPNIVINPVGGSLPPPLWDRLTIGVFANGTVNALLTWYSISSSECVGYIIQRAITEPSVTVQPTTFTTISTVSGKDNAHYTDSAGLVPGYKYWYRIAGQNVKGDNGYWSSVRSAIADQHSVIDDPAEPINLYVYMDNNTNLIGGFQYVDFNLNSNYYTGASVVINGDPNPSNGPLRFESPLSYPDNQKNLTQMFTANQALVTSTTHLYFHVKTLNIWGLESEYVTYGPFTIKQKLSGFTSFMWDAQANFKLLVESHFYSESGDPYTYTPDEFLVNGPNLQYLGEMIAAGSIQTHAMAVGSGTRNFNLFGIEFHQNDNQGSHANYYLRVTTTNSHPFIQLVTDPAEVDTDVITTWYINAFASDTVIQQFAAHPDQVGISIPFGALISTQPPYNVYVKCNKASDTDATIFVTTTKYNTDGGDGYYYYLCGLWDCRTGRAGQLGLSYGFTYIDGNHITTGEIDCNKVTVHGADRNVIIDGTGIQILNGRMTFCTGLSTDPTNNMTIDSNGIACIANNTGFTLNKNTGLELLFGENDFITLNRTGLTIDNGTNRLRATAGGIEITGGDNNSVVLDETGLAGNGFVLDETGLILTKGIIANNSIYIDSTGLHGPNFDLTSAGLDLTGTSPGNIPSNSLTLASQTHIDSSGIWSGTSATSNCVNIGGAAKQIIVYSSTPECYMGLLPDNTYGFWAGGPTGSHVKMNKDGISIYNDDGDVIIDDTDDNTIINSRFNSICLIAGLSGTVSSGRNFSVVLTGFGATGTHGFNYAVAHYSVSSGFTITGSTVPDCSGTNITLTGTVSGNGEAGVGVKVWLYKIDMEFAGLLAGAVSTNWT